MDNRDKIIEIISEYIDLDCVKVSDNLHEMGLIDSLAVLNILVTLQDEFDIAINPCDISKNNFESIEAIIALVEKYSN